jgi:membrane protein YdbS with pleckstrin-like domain
MQANDGAAAIYGIERPSPKLMTYYALKCLLAGPFYPFVLIPHYFKYHTLRYRFDDEGISMSWGILFRKEVILNYSRIQDIHLSSNVVERWLGLAKLEIQTASGSATAEMTIEGLLEFEAIRDFLYTKMRGIKEIGMRHEVRPALPLAATTEAPPPALAETLQAIADELRAIRLAMEQTKAPGDRADD